ncbi:MAG: hydrogenase maturation protease [Georgfuchsia sp.]
MTAPILVFTWGNPSRGDDALGPLLAERIEALSMADVECITDFQLQVEHALDLRGRRRVLFADASIGIDAPFHISRIAPARDASFTTHAMNPQAVMQAYVDFEGATPPPCTLIEMRGDSFELGTGLSVAAQQALEAALLWVVGWIKDPRQYSVHHGVEIKG